MKESRSSQRSDSPRVGASVSGYAQRQAATTQKRFAVFDIDGTLIRWQLYHAIVDNLVKLGHVSAKEFENLKLARLEWKTRSGNTSFKTYESEVVKAYDTAIKRISASQLNEAVESVFHEYKDQVYTYTRNLIEQLKKDGFLIFAISGSQSEIVDKIADYYGFAHAIGTEYERAGEHFTGKYIFHAKDKAAALKKIVKDHELSFRDSVAIGDSKSDVAMLSLVERPIAFNPERELFDVAKQHGWQVVIERKNVIYELKKDGSTYLLA